MAANPADLATLTWIGTATTLLRLGPFTLLTDPNFLHRGQRAYLGYGLSSKRRTDPAIDPVDLPPLDGIVLSHMHGDHWDRVARESLDPALPVITTPHAARRLHWREKFPEAVGLEPWEQHTFEKDDATLTITAMPGTHSTNPLLRALLPPVMGSLHDLSIGGETVARVYVTGDTMPFAQLAEIGRRHPGIDTAVVHAGGTTLPGGFVVTMTGTHAASCLRDVRPRIAVPIHHGDYGVFKEPVEDFLRVVEAARLPLELRTVARGATVSLV